MVRRSLVVGLLFGMVTAQADAEGCQGVLLRATNSNDQIGSEHDNLSTFYKNDPNVRMSEPTIPTEVAEHGGGIFKLENIHIENCHLQFNSKTNKYDLVSNDDPKVTASGETAAPPPVQAAAADAPKEASSSWQPDRRYAGIEGPCVGVMVSTLNTQIMQGMVLTGVKTYYKDQALMHDNDGNTSLKPFPKPTVPELYQTQGGAILNVRDVGVENCHLTLNPDMNTYKLVNGGFEPPVHGGPELKTMYKLVNFVAPNETPQMPLQAANVCNNLALMWNHNTHKNLYRCEPVQQEVRHTALGICGAPLPSHLKYDNRPGVPSSSGFDSYEEWKANQC